MPSEFISLGDSLILSVVGFCVVLSALAALALYIKAQAKVMTKKSNEVASAPAPVVSAPAPVVKQVPPNMVELPETTSMGSCDLHSVSDRDAALIMAIVADQLKAPLNTLVFKSIKEVK